MSDSGIEIEGLEELKDLLSEQHVRRTAQRYLKTAAVAGVQPVKQEMQASVPVRTGLMADSVDVKTRFKSSASGEQLTVKVGVGLNKETYPGKDGKPVSLVAMFLEFGANTRLGRGIERLHKRKTAAQHEQDTIPARHFLKNAWDASKDRCAQAFSEAAKELVDKFKD